TSNSPPPVATEEVILARASFSDRDTKLTPMPGFSAVNRSDRLMASDIWALDTIATTRASSPPLVQLPAPPHPASANAAPTVPTRTERRGNARFGNDPLPIAHCQLIGTLLSAMCSDEHCNSQMRYCALMQCDVKHRAWIAARAQVTVEG